MLCPCGTQKLFESCCQRFILEKDYPLNAEQLMRSRYSAFYLSDINYIKKTMKEPASHQFDSVETFRWMKKIKWIGLKILKTENLSISPSYVEFSAQYIENDFLKTIHERSEFQLSDNRWFYTTGEHIEEPSIVLSQNKPCPCGNSKKYKNCHGQKD
ncbi:MAG: YchJ family protein [Gammaproteobacteria bacterium]|nr:YchJ family protein [Gammaproteobacteria bacterium]